METYKELIERVYKKLSIEDGFFINNPILPDLQEHGLWTYWQGRGVRHPKIMIVGQDWGSQKQSDDYCKYIKEHPYEKVVSFVQIANVVNLKKKEFTTDIQLKRIMEEVFGYSDICENHHEDLYFTNLIPGYRKEDKSTGNGADVVKNITPELLADFKALLELLKPQYVICLGRLVSEQVAKIYGKEERIRKAENYNVFLDEELDEKNPQPIMIGEQQEITMFAMPHLGSLGKANRNGYFKKNEIDRDITKDWEIVAKFINYVKTGLVLEGGGTRGIYTAGVLDAFLEHEIQFDGVIGVSAGAIHGCSYVSKQKGRSIRYYKQYSSDPRFMGVRSWIKTGDFIGADFCYHELPEKLDPYDNEAFKSSHTAFYAVCTDVESGKPQYHLFTDMQKEIDYLRASASLPYFSRLVEIGGRKYLDGGCADSVPIDAFQKMGYEKNVIILTRPRGYKKKPAKPILASVLYRKYPAFREELKKRHLKYNDCIKRIERLEDEGKVLVIRPETELNIGRLENNPEKTQEIYDVGYQDGLRMVEKVKAFLR